MQESGKTILHNEIIVCVFTILLSATASHLAENSSIQKELVSLIWITSGLMIMSLFFRCFFQLIFKGNLTNYVPYFRILTPILFWISIIYIPVYIILFCTIIGIIGFVANPSNSKKKIFSIYYLIIPLVYFVIIGSEVWNMHRTPLPGHYLITESQTGSDMTFYAAITSMLKTYNICSIGIDGLKPMPYHCGTHYFLASLSSLLDCNPLYINQIIAPLVFHPLALFIMLEIFTTFKKRYSSSHNNRFIKLGLRDHLIFASILTTLTNAPFGLPFVANLSFFTSPFQIDSQLLGNLLLGIMIVILCQTNFVTIEKALLDIFFLSSIQSLICIIKSSVSHLSLLIIIYTAFRYSFHRTATQNKLWFLTVTLSLLSTIYINSLITTTNIGRDGILTFGFFELWKNYVPVREWQWIYLSNGFYTLASILLLIYMKKNISTLDILKRFKSSTFSILEVISFLTFTAISLSAVFKGSLSFASTYYMDTAKFISFILLVASISTLFSRISVHKLNFIKILSTNSPLRIISILCVIFILITGTGLSLKGWQRTFHKNLESNLENAKDQNETESKVILLESLLKLSTISENKSQTCLWIPKSNKLFWNDLAEEKNESFLPFWAVALSEMSLIDGYPLSNELNGVFGYESYRSNPIHNKEYNKNLVEIMNESKRKGFKYLIVLWDSTNYETYDLHL